MMDKLANQVQHEELDSEELVELESYEPAPVRERLYGPFNYTKKVMDEIVDMTTMIPLFDRFDPYQLRVIVSHMQVLQLEEGQCLFFEGEEGDYMSFIISGRMEVFKNSVGGKLVSVSEISRGCSIGEMAMIDTYARSATVIAREPTTMLVLKREHFDQISKEDPFTGIAFMKALTRIICLHLRRTSNQYADVCESTGKGVDHSGIQSQVSVAGSKHHGPDSEKRGNRHVI